MKTEKEITVEQNDEFLVRFSERCKLDKRVTLTVPRGNCAIAYIDGKAAYRSNQCVGENVLSRCGKEYAGREIQFAFYSPSYCPEISYGFGPINVNNERLKEAYRVGINGRIVFSVTDYMSLINGFSFSGDITVEAVRQKILPLIKSVGVPIVSSCFVNTRVSVFEIDSMIGEIREKIKSAFLAETAMANLGIKIDSVAINEIYVNEDDLEMIRDRINN